MIPIIEPGNLPLILFLTVTLGIPSGFLADFLWFAISRVPSLRVQRYLPALCALGLLFGTAAFLSGPVTPESYQRTWVFMMITGFLTSAFLILVPFPFFRGSIRNVSPYAVVFIASLATFFILASVGFVGGDAMIPPETDIQRVLAMVSLGAGEAAVAAVTYSLIVLAVPVWDSRRKSSP